MTEHQLIPRIEELGLSNKEARVYVACLELGSASVQKIAEQAGIKRVTTYVVLESLVALGLASQTVRGKKTYFIAEEPSHLERLLEKREQELQEQKLNFDHILGDLKALQALPTDSPNVKFYDSAAGIKTILETFLQEERGSDSDVIYGFSNLDLLLTYVPEFQADMAHGWLRQGVRGQFLYTAAAGPIIKETYDSPTRSSRWLPPDKFPMMGDFTIAGDTILMLSLGAVNPIGVTVTSKALAGGLLALFKVAWEAAGSYNK